MRCPTCNRENPDDARFCVGCGKPFAARCTKCGAENPADSSFCKQCGARFGAKTASSSAATEPGRVGVAGEDAEALDGERKTVTALFADLKGSTELMEDLDPEEARTLIYPALAQAKAVADRTRTDFGRFRELLQEGVISQSEFDSAKASLPALDWQT